LTGRKKSQKVETGHCKLFKPHFVRGPHVTTVTDDHNDHNVSVQSVE